MLTHKNSIQRKWHRRAQLVIFGFVVTIFSSCSKSESADMSFLALLGGGAGGAAPTDPSGPGAGSPGVDSTPPTVLIQNLRDKGIVETGFLIGTAADETGVAAVEVSLDGGAYATATGTTSWSYKMPTGSSTWRDHSQHTISVRSKDSAGNYSSVTTITVRKGINKDINGDGYVDVVVGASNYSSYTGRVYVFHSSGSGGVTSTTAGSASTIITGQGSSKFGHSVATGDVNGDGYADVVVGALAYSSTGRAYVFHSSGSDGVTITAAATASTIITGEASSGFGSSVATGDVNGDGYADVVVGAITYSSSTGRSYVFHSSGSGGVTITAAASASTIITGEGSGNQFGHSVAVSDMNGDGFADVVVGAHGYSSATGRAYLFHSSGTGGVAITAAASASTIITGEGSGNQFGRSVAAGDVNGDGYADVVVGASDYISYTGRVYVFHSSGGGVTSTSAASASTIITGEGTSNSFGSSVATGDVNADGFVDVVVAARGYSSVTGRSYVFHSSGTGGVTITAAASASTIITGEGTNNGFGISVAAGDINGDGYADVVVGAHIYSSNTGRSYVFHSSGTGGVTITAAASASTIITGEGSSNFFGVSVATGDVNGDGFGDVVVGAYSINSNAGRAYAFYSSGSGGVTSTTAGSASTIITGEGTDDRFGYSVAIRVDPRSSRMIASTPFTEPGDRADYGASVDRMGLTISQESSYRSPSMGRHSLHWLGSNSSERDRPRAYGYGSG